jgi:protein KIBRA
MLIPGAQQTLRTNATSDFAKPVFGNNCLIHIALNKLFTKSLQVKIMIIIGQREDWVVSVDGFCFGV